MKKILLILTLFISVSVAKAQGFNYGVKAGWNFSNVNSSAFNSDFKHGFHAGVYANLSAVIIAVQPELLFSQKGFKNSNVDTRLNYIDIPVLVKLKVFPMISVDAGPQYSILVSKATEVIANAPQTSPSYNNGELGGVVGMSLQVLRFGASARYCFGLQDLEDNGHAKNRLFQVSLSLKI